MSSTVIEDAFRSAQLDEHQKRTSTQVSERKRDGTEREMMEISSCMYSSLFFTLPQKKVSRTPHSDQTCVEHRGRKATSNSLRTIAERKGLMVSASFISDCMYACT